MLYIKAFICLVIIAWCWLGFYMIARFSKLFGAHADDPSETAGARSYGIVQAFTIWIAMLGLFIFILTL